MNPCLCCSLCLQQRLGVTFPLSICPGNPAVGELLLLCYWCVSAARTTHSKEGKTELVTAWQGPALLQAELVLAGQAAGELSTQFYWWYLIKDASSLLSSTGDVFSHVFKGPVQILSRFCLWLHVWCSLACRYVIESWADYSSVMLRMLIIVSLIICSQFADTSCFPTFRIFA